MIHAGAKILFIICKVHMSPNTPMAEVIDFVEYFLANDLFWYKYINYKLKC